MRSTQSTQRTSVIGGTFAGLVMTHAAAVLVTNLLLCLVCLPLLVVLLTTDPRVSWPLLALLMPIGGPALSGVFTVCALIGDRDGPDGVRSIVIAFFSGWRAGWRRCFGIAVGATALVTIAVLDFAFLSGKGIGALLGPLLLLVAGLAAFGGVQAIAVQTMLPSVRLGALLKLTTAATGCQPLLMLVSLIAIGTQLALFFQFPALALGISGSLMAYLCWSHVRHGLVHLNAIERPEPAGDH
ncbi:hypothetical protein C8D81_3472 [Enemella evansiae]|nr:hypothetical protein C8D81_3472 [Enemella evansiae]